MNRLAMLAGAFFFSCGIGASADVITMQNGDRISGKIEKIADGKMTVKSDFMGSVTLDMSKVVTFSTDSAIRLQFKDGTAINQKVAASEGGKIAAGEGVLPKRQFSLGSIKSANLAEPKAEWHGHVTAGGTLTEGNTETTTASIDANVVRRSEADRITLGGRYLFSSNESKEGDAKTTADRWFGEAKYDYFVTKKLYSFADGTYEKDRIAKLDGREVGTLGLGYQWIDGGGYNFRTDLGAGGMHEAYKRPSTTNDTIAGLAGWHLDGKMTKALTLIHEFRATPDLAEMANYKAKSSLELRAALTKVFFASFKTLVDYDSHPAADRKKTDTAYIVGVGVNF